MIIEPGNAIQAHFGRYTRAFYIAIAALAVGLLFGILAIGTLTPSDKLSLIHYIRQFLNQEAAAPTYHGIFKPMLAGNLKMLGLLYLLGVSVAGMPLILIVVFFRGFVLGFSSAFLIGTLQWQGFWVSVIGIFLQNLFVGTAFVIVAAVALGFSWELISPKSRKDGWSIPRGFAFFTGLVIVMACVNVVGTALEAYVAPFLLHVLSTWGI